MLLRDNFSYFSLKPYGVTPHLNHLATLVLMRGLDLYFCGEEVKMVPKLSLLALSYLKHCVRQFIPFVGF